MNDSKKSIKLIMIIIEGIPIVINIYLLKYYNACNNVEYILNIIIVYIDYLLLIIIFNNNI